MKRYFLVAACFTLAQLQDEGCKNRCVYAHHFRSGMFVEATGKCWCGKLEADLSSIEPPMRVPSKLIKTALQPSVPFKPSFDESIPKQSWED